MKNFRPEPACGVQPKFSGIRPGGHGFTMPEVLVALVIVAVGFAGTWMSAGRCLQLAKAHRETIAATETLLGRVEDTRAAGWSTIVSGAGIRDKILATASADAQWLPGLEEQITVTTYPAVIPAPTPIIVQRHADGTVQIVSDPAPGLYLRSILAVRADFSLTWKSGPNQRLRRRENSTVISVQGLLK